MISDYLHCSMRVRSQLNSPIHESIRVKLENNGCSNPPEIFAISSRITMVYRSGLFNCPSFSLMQLKFRAEFYD